MMDKISTRHIIIVIAFILIAWFLYVYWFNKSSVFSGMEDGQVMPASAVGTSAGSQMASSGNGYTSKPVLNPSELLPQDVNSQWSSLNPNLNMANSTPDLLQAGYHIGIDTIGQTLRNANQQLRSDPIIQKVNVGPWNQSTIEPDIARVPLEIGI